MMEGVASLLHQAIQFLLGTLIFFFLGGIGFLQMRVMVDVKYAGYKQG